MLKKRIVAVLVVRNNFSVQSINFKEYRPLGKPEIAAEFFSQWGADEIILLDISATRQGRGPDLELIKKVAAKCIVPLTVGGGITHISHVDALIHSGADKIALNHALYRNPRLISEIAKVFGTQSVVVSIDAVRETDGYKAYDYISGNKTEQYASSRAQLAVELGAGEVFLNSVDRDGLGIGFDTHLVGEISRSINVPVICAGGAGSPEHFLDVFKATNVHAAAAANFFNFTEHSISITKSMLFNQGVLVRHDTHADYSDNLFDPRGRLLKKPEYSLENLLFERIVKEVI